MDAIKQNKKQQVWKNEQNDNWNTANQSVITLADHNQPGDRWLVLREWCIGFWFWTKPFLSENTVYTMPRGHYLLGVLGSTTKTTLPTCKLKIKFWKYLHLTHLQKRQILMDQSFPICHPCTQHVPNIIIFIGKDTSADFEIPWQRARDSVPNVSRIHVRRITGWPG